MNIGFGDTVTGHRVGKMKSGMHKGMESKGKEIPGLPFSTPTVN